MHNAIRQRLSGKQPVQQMSLNGQHMVLSQEYLILSFIHTGYKQKLRYKEANTEIDMDIVAHAPQRPVEKVLITWKIIHFNSTNLKEQKMMIMNKRSTRDMEVPTYPINLRLYAFSSSTCKYYVAYNLHSQYFRLLAFIRMYLHWCCIGF